MAIRSQRYSTTRKHSKKVSTSRRCGLIYVGNSFTYDGLFLHPEVRVKRYSKPHIISPHLVGVETNHATGVPNETTH